MPEKTNFKTIIAFSVELVLMRIGGSEYRSVLSKLENEFNSSITECYENPIALRKVLMQVYRDRYGKIIDNLEGELMEWQENNEIKKFLNSLRIK